MDANALITATKEAAQANYATAMQTRASANLTGAQTPAKVREAAQKFEAFFVGQMMEYMSAGIKADDTFGGGQAEETWRSMLNQEYGKEIAKSGRLGIADMIGKEMLKMQEKRSAAATAQTAAPAPDAADAEPTAAHSAIVAASVARYAQAATL
jgi:Rod binding domain-containing protein